MAIKYYVFKDLPAKWDPEDRTLPVKIVKGQTGGNQEVVVYELQEFMTLAMPVSKSRFDELAESLRE